MSDSLNDATHNAAAHGQPAVRAAVRGRGWGWIRWNLIRFSPFDLRVIIRVLLGLIVWKILSSDYSAIPSLIQGPDIHSIHPRWMNSWIDAIQVRLFDQNWKVVSLQLIAAASLILTGWRLNRLLLLPGVLILCALQLSASQYRGILYDFEAQLSLLVIALAWPLSWKRVFHGGPEVTPAATTLGTCWAAYVGIAYLMTGLSKIVFDPYWFNSVRLDLLIPAMEIWHSTILPDWLMSTATFQRQLFSVPYVSAIMAAGMLALEMFWLLAIVSKWCRRIIPISMFCGHVAIFLGSGILFLPMAVSGISIMTPWRYLASPMTLYFDPDSALARRIAVLCSRFNWFGNLKISAVHAGSTAEVPTEEPVGNNAIIAEDSYGQYAGATAVSRALLRCGVLAPLGIVTLLPVVRLLTRGGYALLIRADKLANSGASDKGRRPQIHAAQFDTIDALPLRSSPLQRFGYVLGIMAAVYLACFPTVLKTYFYPFINYHVFGWSYASAAQPTEIYRLGYLDRRSNTIEFIPVNHGGFLDFNMVSCPHPDVKGYLNAENDERRKYHTRRLQQYQRALRPHGSSRWLLGPFAHPNHVVAKSDAIPLQWFDQLYFMQGHSEYNDGQVQIEWTVRGRLPRFDSRSTPTDRMAGKAVQKK